MAVGMSMDLKLLISDPLLILGILMAMLLIKTFVLMVLGRIRHHKWRPVLHWG